MKKERHFSKLQIKSHMPNPKFEDVHFMNICTYHTEIHFVTVPSQTPNITKIYLTSANSFKVFWVTPGDEPIDGYRVAYRSLKGGGGWSTLAVDKQTSSLHLKKLPEGTVYVVRVLAFNSHGNGIPGGAKEIKMDEGGSFTGYFTYLLIGQEILSAKCDPVKFVIKK